VELIVARAKSYFEDCISYLDWLSHEIGVPSSVRKEAVLKEVLNGDIVRKSIAKNKTLDPTPQKVQIYRNSNQGVCASSHQGSLFQWSTSSGWLS
jgi:hypothetical protein